MPNDRHRRHAARRTKSTSRLRVAPVILLGLVAAAVLGRAPSGDAPVRWTIRAADAWMTDFEGVREVRTAALAASRVAVAQAAPAAADVATPVPTPIAAGPSAVPVETALPPARIVVAEADLPPRDVPKQIPLAVEEPAATGVVHPTATEPRVEPRNEPTINRSGKGDRLFAPTPLGRATERDLMIRPSLAVVPPSLDGWPPLMSVASLIAPQTSKTLPRLAWAPTSDDDTGDQRLVVAMVRSGPGRVVTESAIAAIGTDRSRVKGRVVLPPVPEAQVASAGPRSRIWASPAMPEMGYARRPSDVEFRFKALLGDEDDAAARPAGNPDEQLPP